LRALNAGFRRLDRPTNVLSFPAAPGDPSFLGDIAMAYGVVKREARTQGKLFSAHAAHLAVHGTLHLLGYDHETPHDARTMESLEIRLLATLGIADPYAPRPYTRGLSCA
jgi:probable rRNA maturation factor